MLQTEVALLQGLHFDLVVRFPSLKRPELSCRGYAPANRRHVSRCSKIALV